MKALVTGANGFVGSHLVRHLLDRGDDVRAMVRATSNLALLDGVEPDWVHADITDPESLVAAVDGVDVVFHVAGAISALDQAGFDRVNRDGTVHLIDACLAAHSRPRRFVLVSSIAAAGPSDGEHAATEADEPRPVSMYGRSKRAGELATSALDGQIDVSIVRPPVVYGSGDSATFDLFRAIARGVSPRQTGDPPRMSFVHVHDLVRGMRLVATSDAAVGRTYFLVGPDEGTMFDFQAAIARAMNARPLAVPVPPWAMRLAGGAASGWQRMVGRAQPFGRDKVVEALQPGWLYSGARARDEVGFVGSVGFDEGVAEALAWYRDKGWLS